MMRYAEYKECDVVIVDNEEISTFNDFEDISDYALDSLKWCINEKLILGYNDNYLKPKNYATRAQTACVFYRLLFQMIINEKWEYFTSIIAIESRDKVDRNLNI